jgi:hypothetical protein
MATLLASVNWTVIGVLLTALFTGTLVLIGLLSYQHGKQRAGHRKPVIVKKEALGLGWQHFDDSHENWPEIEEEYNPDFVRILVLYMFNKSDVEQTIAFRWQKSKVVWPRTSRDTHFIPRDEVTLAPNTGGNVVFLVIAHEAWDHQRLDKKDPMKFAQHYWIRAAMLTRSRIKIRWLGRTRLYVFPASSAWVLGPPPSPESGDGTSESEPAGEGV